MATATVNSILLSSPDPDALSRWYGEVFEAEVHREMGPYGVIDLDGFYVMFDKRDDVTGANPNGARLILNLEIDDPAATAARIDEMGGEWVSALENRDGHRFATAKDPDGNWIQLIRLDDETEARMAQPTTPFSGFAVRDTEEASAFYRDVLGMRVLPMEMGNIGIRIDRRTTVLAYPRSDHQPGSFTVLNIPVRDIDAAVDDLVGKGVSFLHIEGMPQDDKGVMRGYGPDIAWFTDPSGNMISVLAVLP
ncbi:MAG: VOC family protein [Rhodococcus sp. (in: high G+C Gram-positive bacteria)]